MPAILASSTPVFLRRNGAMSNAEVASVNDRLEGVSPTEVVAWAVVRFGRRLAVTASFADTLLIDMAVAVDPDIEVVFLDTGFHFSETLATVRKAQARYSLNLTVLRPRSDAADVWADGSKACCAARKTEPLFDYMANRVDGWITGLRRSDGPTRSATPIVEVGRGGLIKVNPLAAMTGSEVDAYVSNHDVIVNPLAGQGYSSIGCWPCTEASEKGRGGRWAGSSKTECGLHP